jgi:hypothetical protein
LRNTVNALSVAAARLRCAFGSMVDRRVRFFPNFFDELDAQLPADRTADGVPLAADFLVFDLPPIRDLLAADVELATVELLSPPLRVMVAAGTRVSPCTPILNGQMEWLLLGSTLASVCCEMVTTRSTEFVRAASTEGGRSWRRVR